MTAPIRTPRMKPTATTEAPTARAPATEAPVRAADIIRADETLLAAYLLRFPSEGSGAALTDEKASQFLLWFALNGRRNYQQVCFSPDYLAFLAKPIPPYASRLAAYVMIARPDLQKAFGTDLDRYHAWYYGEGVRRYRLAPFVSVREQQFLAEIHPFFAHLRPSLTRAAYFAYLRDPGMAQRFDLRTASDRNGFLATLKRLPPNPFEPWMPALAPRDRADLPGCNVIGFADGVLGIGEDARAITAVLGHAGVPRSVYNVKLPEKAATSDNFEIDALYEDRPIFPINIFALTAFETARLKIEQGAGIFAGRYNIGYWPWELTSLPDDWRFVFDLVDEIWASSDFLVDVYSRLTTKPVHRVPLYLNSVETAPVDLEPFGLKPDDVIFLTMFDFNSYVARKNPEAAIAAFQAAFPDRDGPERMIIKTLNSHAHPDRLKALEERLGDDDRFVLVDGPFSRAEVCGLIEACDCFVSLHRSEGFGRVIAEAMHLQTPVVATNWSGNTSFIDADVGYVVDYTLRPVAKGEYVFHEGSEWAEPSVEDAAAKLRLVRARINRDGAMRERAKARVQNLYGLVPVSEVVTARLEAIRPLIRGR